MRAFCWASGRIEFAKYMPDGALPIARGPSKPLREFISVRARHAYDGETLLVPGVPEAPDQGAALVALQAWLAWCAKSPPPNVEVL